MIFSMTAFTKHEIQNTYLTGSWEIRSINQRYLEIYIYLPEKLKNLENEIRTIIINTNNIKRGRIECKLYIDNINNKFTQEEIILNTKLIKNLITAIKKIYNKHTIQKIDPIKILSWPGVILPKNNNNCKKNYPIILQTFKEALNKIILIRQNEGMAIKNIIEQRLSKITIEIKKIQKIIPIAILHQKQQLLKKIEEINTTINNKRLEEEILFYTQRTDISEEIDRLAIHIKHIILILNSERIVGRKLDFFIQEIYKETNTISAKSTNTKITQSSVEIKILTEQIREQIQNIE